jgi:hypothetical protein
LTPRRARPGAEWRRQRSRSDRRCRRQCHRQHLTVADGYGWQLAGGILNNGALTLDHVTVTGNTMATDAGDFWQGGGGIYNGDGATLNLVDSAVVDNHGRLVRRRRLLLLQYHDHDRAQHNCGNVSNDVGGGLRLLGNARSSTARSAATRRPAGMAARSS